MIYGVPQGIVLGLLLLLIYINEQLKYFPSNMFILFSDEANIFASGRIYAEIINRASEVLGAVFKCMLANKLHIK